MTLTSLLFLPKEFFLSCALIVHELYLGCLLFGVSDQNKISNIWQLGKGIAYGLGQDTHIVPCGRQLQLGQMATKKILSV